MEKKYSILLLLIFYLFFQLSSLDYGNKINNYYENIETKDSSLITNELSKNKRVIDNKNTLENKKKIFFRYKLYSIEADEMLSIIALSKIAVSKKIDPYYYQYGGAFLYPLGAYYFILKELNIINFNNFDELLEDESKIDQIYFYGRLFVLISFIVSAYILYSAFKLIIPQSFSLKLVTLYLFVPSSIMFSQIIKPHWYSLIWINLIIYNLIKIKIKDSEFVKRLIYISIFMGLCIGSAFYNIIFIIFTYFVIFFYLKKKNLNFNNILISGFFLLLSFLIINPALILNTQNILNEYLNLFNWFKGNIDYSKVLNFYKNSLITGFGLANIIYLIYSIFLKKNYKYLNLLLLILIPPMVIMSFLTAQQDNWHINFRYLPFFLPSMLLFFGIFKNKIKPLILNTLILLTIVQMFPLKIAYLDENNEKYSTRINASKWITKNIDVDNKICIDGNDPAPFNMPPIDFNKFNIVNKECEWKILTIRNNEDYKKIKNENIVNEFNPRFLYKFPKTIFSHINPIIVIIKT